MRSKKKKKKKSGSSRTRPMAAMITARSKVGIDGPRRPASPNSAVTPCKRRRSATTACRTRAARVLSMAEQHEGAKIGSEKKMKDEVKSSNTSGPASCASTSVQRK